MIPGGGCQNPTTNGQPAAVSPPQLQRFSQHPMTLAATAYDQSFTVLPDYSDSPHHHYYLQQQQHHHQLQQQHHHQLQQQHYNYNDLIDCKSFSVTTPSPVTSIPLSPQENNNFIWKNNHITCSASSSLSPSSLSSSSSSSSSIAPMTAYRRNHHHVFSPSQTHDCYGVPVHPSVSDFPQQPSPAQCHNHRYNAQHVTSLSQQQQHQHQQRNNYPLSYDHQGFSAVTDVKSDSYNSSRQMRNLAEKQRRNKLNTCINELSQLVPLISNATKKIEKTSVLRLSAAYLRLSRLLMGFKEQREELPGCIKEVNLADLLLDDRDIYLMVTSAGKIVFISHSVENILGHPQIDLMGQLLYNITCLEDHDELAKNLKYEDETTSSSIVNDPTLLAKQRSDGGFKLQRRSFYIRLVKKAVSRGEQPELELVHVVGTLMMRKSGSKNALLGGNDIVLNAVVRPYNERRVTEVSLLEATREEYITRHQIDGRIIYVDHRISIVSGFMPQEVSGTLAFTYMHKDDVRWVMIALRQMYFKGQSYGSSCYRLLSKNGEFVYMKTYGYLELNPNENSIQSFTCVNTLVDAEEGKKEILKMRKRFTPLIHSQTEPGIAAISHNQFMKADTNTSLENATTEDPSVLSKVIEQMYTNIPAPAIDNVKETALNPGPLPPDSQFLKVALFSKSMPPILSAPNAPKIDKQSSLSPQPNVKPLTQDRPSVLRVAPPIARQPVVVCNQQTIEKSAEKDREYLERRGGILVVPKRHNDLRQLPEHSLKKAKIGLETQIDSPTCSQYSNHMDGSQSDNQLSTDGYVSMDDFSSFQDTPIQLHSIEEHEVDDFDSLTEVHIMGLDQCSKTLDENKTLVDPLFSTPESYLYNNDVYNERNPSDVIQDPIMHVLQQAGNVESELLEKKQITLKTKMDQQQGQLKEIQTELNSLSSNADTHFLTTNYSNLKAVHEKQQQMLRTLQGVHQNIGV